MKIIWEADDVGARLKVRAATGEPYYIVATTGPEMVDLATTAAKHLHAPVDPQYLHLVDSYTGGSVFCTCSKIDMAAHLSAGGFLPRGVL